MTPEFEGDTTGDVFLGMVDLMSGGHGDLIPGGQEKR
jgi:hypothetical protein